MDTETLIGIEVVDDGHLVVLDGSSHQFRSLLDDNPVTSQSNDVQYCFFFLSQYQKEARSNNSRNKAGPASTLFSKQIRMEGYRWSSGLSSVRSALLSSDTAPYVPRIPA